MKKVLALLVILTLSLGIAQQEEPPVARIGTLLSYTGSLAEFGPAIRNGAELAAMQINAAAEAVFGGPILELIHEDSATNPATAVDRARKLINTDQVDAIMGALSSGVTVTVAQSVTIPANVLLISPASTSPLITVLEDQDFVFRTVASDALQGIVAGQMARGELNDILEQEYGFDTAATIYLNNPYGQGLSNAFTEAFEARGGKVLAQVAVPEEPQPTYAAALQQALAGDPGILLVATYPGQATVLLAESRDLFDYHSWQFVDGTKSQEIIEAVGVEALAGDLGTAPGSNPEFPGRQQFVEMYQAEYGEVPPLPFIDTAYDAVAAIGLAVAQTIIDGAEINSANIRDRLRAVANEPGEAVGVGQFEDAFRLMQMGAQVNYTGAASAVNFDDAGEVITPVEVWKYTDEGTIESVTVRTADEIPAE